MRFLFLLLFLPLSSAFSGTLSDFIIISDIDDTIELTEMGPTRNIVSLAFNLLNLHDAFIGMPTLYQQLASQGASFFYVSNKPRFLSFSAVRFLENSEFPPGDLLLRKSLFTPGRRNKVEAISKILNANPDKRVILIGDDGEEDILVYQYFQSHEKYNHRIEAVYIHDLYRPAKLDIKPGQTPFYTAADFGLRFHLRQQITFDQLGAIFKTVQRGFHSRRRAIREKTFPGFAEIELKPLEELTAGVSVLPEPLRAMGFDILNSIRARGCRAQISQLR